MPKFTVTYEVTCVVTGQIEVEAESEVQAQLLVQNMDPGTLEVADTVVQSWFVEVLEAKETTRNPVPNHRVLRHDRLS